MDQVEMLITSAMVTNAAAEAIVITGVELVGDGDLSVIEGATLPRNRIGATYMPEPKIDISIWEQSRASVPGAVIEAGATVELAYHVDATPTAFIERAEWTYEDQSGDEYVLSDKVSVAVDWPGTGCAAR
jgi:hypothetical protein